MANTNFPKFSEETNFNSGTIKNGGQKSSTSVWQATHCNVKIPLTGEWYFEYITDNYVYAWMGIGRVFVGTSNQHNNDFSFTQGGEYRYNGSNEANTSSIGTGDIIGVYINNGIIKVYVNNSLDHTYSTNLSAIGDENIYPWAIGSSNTTVNFGQDSSFLGVKTAQGKTDANGFGDFYYDPPGNALALCSANTPIDANIDPAQTNNDYPTKQFNVVTYTGNGSTQNITGLGFQPDMVWIKSRSSGEDPSIYDSNRGVTKRIKSSATEIESTVAAGFTAFGSDGFSLGSATENNDNSETYVGWGWKANGGTTVSNSQGSITATVQANQAAGFSIVTYAGGNGSWGSSSTFGHGLSAAPEFMMFKERNNTDAWTVFHHSVGNGGGSSAAHNNLRLDNNDALYTNQSYKSFAGVMPTATLVTVDGNTTNSSSSNHIAYIWHGVEGYSKFGRFIGNGNVKGPFVFLGFRPRLLVIKGISATNNWMVFDTARTTNNPIQKNLHWDTGDTEETSTERTIDILSNGFKLRSDNGTLNHPANDVYVYMAWGDVPFKYANTF